MAHSTKDAVIALRSIEGTWTHVGVDVGSEVYHEGLKLDWDLWGPSTASFTLKRQPRVQWPDIKAFTDVEVTIDGTQCWKGRVKDTPSREGAEFSIEVACEGMQYHLDDDVYMPFYVHNRVDDWKDASSHPNAQLGAGAAQISAASKCSIEGGAITLAFPRSLAHAQYSQCIAYLDLGPDTSARAKSVAATVQGSASHGEFKLICRVGDTVSAAQNSTANQSEQLFSVTNGSNTTTSGTATTPRRYVLFICENDLAVSYTDLDSWFRVTDIKVFTESAYMSSNASALKASTVVSSAATRAPLLDISDTSLVTATSLNIPDFATLDNKTPREVINAANAYHNYLTKVDERARLVFKPLPSAATVEVGAWTALEGTDASQNSGDDIYSRVIVEARDSLGAPAPVERSQGTKAGVPLAVITSPGPDNPSFDTDTSSWSAQFGSITRSTSGSDYDTSPGGGVWTPNIGSGFDQLTETFSGTFMAGMTYILECRMKAVSATSPSVAFGAAGAYDTVRTTFNLTTSFQTFQLVWTPRVTRTSGVTLVLTTFAGTVELIDTLVMYKAIPTLVERRGFRRTKVLSLSSIVDTAGTIGAAVGDAFLANHKLAQFKGNYSVTGNAREVLTGTSVPPEQLGMRTGELLRLSDSIDPDTGAVGRDGRIASVSYTLDTDTAEVAIDNTSNNFEALLARLALFSGGGGAD